MRVPRTIVSLAAIGLLVGTLGAGVTSSAATGDTRIYLVLGDSRAASFQPNGDLHDGYAEQVFQLEQLKNPNLRLVKLACPGERTSTIDKTRRACPYDEGTQLDQAIAVLSRGNVAFVSLQIGANDALRCFNFRKATFEQDCIDHLLPKSAARLTSIVDRLRAADPEVPIFGANYDDPLLAFWTAPGFPHSIVRINARVFAQFNDNLEETYDALDVPVADIAGAFSSQDFETKVHVRGFGELPLNVARACEWTWACQDQYDHDFHPTTVGYAVMTQAWEAKLG